MTASIIIYDLKLPKTWPFATILSDRDLGDSPWPFVRVDKLVARRRPPVVARPGRPAHPTTSAGSVPTSGLDRIPKGVALTHGAVHERIVNLGYLFGEDRGP